MREIKFRVWDRRGEAQGIPSRMYSGKLQFAISISGALLEYDAENGYIGTYGTDQVVVMQYTGLKDKNGTEIYEGDIVTGDSHERLDVVVFREGCFVLRDAMMYYEASYWGDEIEVKGNIYENPELVAHPKSDSS